jgi:hypothetical protein
VTVFELDRLEAVGEREQLVSETDTEYRELAFAQLFQLGDDRRIVRGIAPAVGQHDTVGSERERILRRRRRWNARHTATVAYKHAFYIVLRAEVVKHDFERMLGVDGVDFGHTAARRVLHGVSHSELLDLRELSRHVFKTVSQHRAHDAARSQLARQRAYVYARYADDAVAFEIIVELAVLAEVRPALAQLAHDIARKIGLCALRVVLYRAVIADKRECLRDYLSVIARVGKRLHVTAHRRSEYRLAPIASPV